MIFSYKSLNIENILIVLICFAVLTGIVVLIFSNDKILLRVSPYAIATIGIMAIIRIVFPFPLIVNHLFVYRGTLRHIFIWFNRAWNKDAVLFNKISALKLLLLFWLLGATVKLVIALVKYRKALKYIKLVSVDFNECFISTDILTDRDLQFIKKHRIELRKTDCIRSPRVCGLFNKLILLPNNTDINNNELRVIIAHELSHIRHGDLIKKFILFLIGIVYWWFPFYGIFYRYSDDVMEILADRKAAGKNDYIYLKAILNIMDKVECKEETEVLSDLHPKALYSKKSDMSRRFKKLMYKKKESIFLSVIITFFSLSLFVSSYLFDVSSCYTFDEQKILDAKEGYISANPMNSYAIKKSNGTYEEYIDFGDCNYELTGTYENIKDVSYGIPLFNEKGEEIKWPFFI